MAVDNKHAHERHAFEGACMAGHNKHGLQKKPLKRKTALATKDQQMYLVNEVLIGLCWHWSSRSTARKVIRCGTKLPTVRQFRAEHLRPEDLPCKEPLRAPKIPDTGAVVGECV
jgi:hypothetical protein